MIKPLAASLRIRVLIAMILLPVIFPITQVVAQTTSGTLRGQILDDAGKGLAGAKVTVVNEENQNTRAALTDQNGGYEIFFLPPGFYRITGSLANYTDGSTSHFQIPLNCITPLRPPDITLRPLGQTAPPPQTTAPAREVNPGTNTTDPTRRGNFISDQIEALPLGDLTNMRTFDQLAILLPGVSPPPYTPGVRGPGVGFGIGTAGEFSVNGMRARSNNFTVDGSDDNDPDVGVRRQGFVALVPQSIESINELEVSTLLWDSELGRNFGSQVNAVTRSGGSRYHGQAYGFLTDSALNARNFFDYTQKDPFTRSQTGFVIGGPAWDSATQFFGSFEHITIHDSSEQHFAVPTEADRRFLGLPSFALLA
ncbi:MAG TPA: carboxypeptidase-like regulatory domain-containing protein, partial [Blastocatellia bacterium]|nr:carboxypeptidase-like regulatory domain-containing protein [Blastocatellia bacterium]